MSRATPKISLAFIGGSGLYAMKAFARTKELHVKTPFGAPSGPIAVGELSGVPCAFLPRHGQGHTILPSEINVRANIYALKSLGVERIVAAAAVGSLKEELPPRHFVFPDQIMDETKGRASTFFGNGIVAHIAFDSPFCQAQSSLLNNAARQLAVPAYQGGTYICMEGPNFSTKAESQYHRRMGYDIIGMTAIPEAKLAREAEICYSLMAMVTDYDCWKTGEEVDAGKVIATLSANAEDAQKILERTAAQLAGRDRNCACAKALSVALVTDRKAMKAATVKKLNLLIGKYLKKK